MGDIVSRSLPKRRTKKPWSGNYVVLPLLSNTYKHNTAANNIAHYELKRPNQIATNRIPWRPNLWAV